MLTPYEINCKATNCICATVNPASCAHQAAGHKLIHPDELNHELPKVVVVDISMEERWGKYLAR